MEFAVDCYTVSVDHLERMRAVAIHKAEAVGGSPVREQEHDLDEDSYGWNKNNRRNYATW